MKGSDFYKGAVQLLATDVNLSLLRPRDSTPGKVSDIHQLCDFDAVGPTSALSGGFWADFGVLVVVRG